MGQVLHGSATTTAAVRRAIQHSQESLRALASRYGVNQKTIAKWRQRSTVDDLPTGPKQARSTTLCVEDEALVVAFRRHTLLPLDDCLYVLQSTIPHLTRSSLHRCLQRHDISRLPEIEGNTPARRKFKAYPPGTFHIDIAEVHTAQGRLCLLVVIDRTTRFAFVARHEKATRRIAGDFLRALVKAVSYGAHTVLADNGPRFTSSENLRSAAAEIRRPWTTTSSSSRRPPSRPAFGTTSTTAWPSHAIRGPGAKSNARDARPVPKPLGRLRQGLQLRPTAEDPQGPHAP